MGQFAVGQSVKRKEDIRFATGQGHYTDDYLFDGQLYGAFVRSVMPHANLASVDIDAALATEGVVGVYLQKDIEAAGFNPLPCLAPPVPAKEGQEFVRPPRYVLAKDRVRHVGEPIAFVVAETLAAARDGAEAVFVDYDDIPHNTDTEAALSPEVLQLFDSNPNNLAFDFPFGNEEEAEAEIASAAHVTTIKLINNRVAVMSLEPRVYNVIYNCGEDHFTFYTPTQGATLWRQMASFAVLQMKPEQVRVVTSDVGGSFGMKGFLYPEQIACAAAAKALGRPVKWTSDRTEAFLTDNQGRDNVTEAKLAIDKDGRFTALRVDTIANMGAYLSGFAPAVGSYGPVGQQLGVYDIPAFYLNAKGVFTNTCTVDAYRGAGRPEASYVIERLVDKAAHELGLEPDELRRRNFVRPDQMPYSGPSGFTLDSGDFETILNEGMKRADWDGFATRKAATEAEGKLRGRGLIYYMEKTGGMDNTTARIRLEADGRTIIFSPEKESGQGHETVFAQIVADKLGVDFDKIEFRSGDTDEVAMGAITGGSSGAQMSGGAVDVASDTVIDKGKEIAARELQVEPFKLAFNADDSHFEVPGTNQRMTLSAVVDIAMKEEGDGDGWNIEGSIGKAAPTFPNGTHIMEVEIDPETGVVAIDKYTAVNDFGLVLNPMIVEGQVHGGIAQGFGQAAGEEIVYDETGQLITASLQDYFIPRADHFPMMDLATHEVRTGSNQLGVKGCGEAGANGSPSAYIAAILDALRPLGITELDMPVTPKKLWHLMKAAQQ